MKIDIPDQRKVLIRYGADAQSMVHMEECAELIQAVSKMRRTVNSGEDTEETRRNLVEEISDVLICMEQMQEAYRIPDTELQDMVNRKWSRQEQRL